MTIAVSHHEWALAVLCEEHRPDAAVTVSEWADQHRVLSSKASAEPGLWRTSRTPYLREIMDALSSYSTVEQVVVMKGAQIGMSEAALNFVGYCIHHSPGPALYVMPTVDTVKKISTTRLDPMIEASPSLSERVGAKRSRDSSNSMFSKDFLGGVLLLTGANSASALRSMPIRFLVLDEVDAYPLNVDEEGDPVSLAIKRTANFLRRKIFMLSTPSLKGFSRIGKAFREGDQRYFNVKCDRCGHLQPITWQSIKWEKGRPETAEFECQGSDPETGELCGHRHPEHRKAALLSGGEWVPTAEPSRPGLRSYHISSLYSPWQHWEQCVREFLACFGEAGVADPAMLQPFVNTVLGEEWEDTSGERVDAEGLIDLREDLWPVDPSDGDRCMMLPAKVAVLSAGLDVQDDRIECELVGWGRDEESWSIEYRVFVGDPSGKAVWSDVDAFLAQRWSHPAYPEGLRVAAACIDSGGHHTLSTYAFARERESRKVWAIKGATDPRAPIWPRKPSRNNKGRVNLFIVGVSAAKDMVYKRLARVGPEAHGAGACHFPMSRDADYFNQLTAETKKTKYINGFPRQFWWKPDGTRNEALDVRVYAYAALHGLISMGLRLNAQASRTAERLAEAIREGHVHVTKPAAIAAAPAPVKNVAAMQRKVGRRTSRSSFMG